LKRFSGGTHDGHLQRDTNRVIAGCHQLEFTARQRVRELEIAQRRDGNSTCSDVSRVKQRSDHSAGRCLHPRRPLGVGEIRHASQKLVVHVPSIMTRLMTKLWSQMGHGWDWATRTTRLPQIGM
jgi:hypothetical protein